MPESAITTRGLVKEYRLYERALHRALDAFGLYRPPADKAKFLRAVDGVDLTIMRGEKVAIIGSNGAGKSTLLRMLAGSVQPSEGTIEVNGDVQALLQFDAGFFPDFSGRENVYSYLSQLGLPKDEIAHRSAEIFEFAEIDNYIDQPLRFYSLGMASRLIFATATAQQPDILLVDEVLSAGDAYFTQKCVRRMHSMTHEGNASIVLVSHEIYQAAKICDRMIYMEQGRIVFDGSSTDCIKVYEDAVRRREEENLINRKLNATPQGDTDLVILEIEVPRTEHDENRIVFKSLNLCCGDQTVAQMRLSQAVESSNSERLPGPHLKDTGIMIDSSQWEHPIVLDGIEGRKIKDTGSTARRAFVALPAKSASTSDDVMHLSAYLYCDSESEVWITAKYRKRKWRWKAIFDKGWAMKTLGSLDLASSEHETEISPDLAISDTTFGSERIIMTHLDILDSDGIPKSTLSYGDSATFRIMYRTISGDFDESPQIAIVIHSNGVECVSRSVCRSLHISSGSNPRGEILFNINRLNLSAGHYSITVLIAKPGYYDNPSETYFSTNPDVYYCAPRCKWFVMQSSPPELDGAVFAIEGSWSSFSKSI